MRKELGVLLLVTLCLHLLLLLLHLHHLLLLLHLHGVAGKPGIGHVVVTLGLELSVGVGRLHEVGTQGIQVPWVVQVIDH